MEDRLEKKSFYGDPLGKLPPNPLVGTYGWSTHDPRMFIPPWYPSVIIRLEPISKLLCRKLQHPTYVKDTNPSAHIRIFKKVIKESMETMEVDIINMFDFTLRDNISK